LPIHDIDHVRLDNPLKQGLKQPLVPRPAYDRGVRLDNPLKQGLKHDDLELYRRLVQVRLDNPLKQGLKLHRRRGDAGQ